MLLDCVNGKNNSWAIRWYGSVFLKHGFCLHPNISLVRNIWHDDAGVHCKQGWWSEMYTKQKITDSIEVKPIELKECEEAREALKKFYEGLNNAPLWVKVKDKLQRIIKNKVK